MKTEPSLEHQNLDEAGNRESRETGDELFLPHAGDFKGRSPFSNL